MSFRWLFIPTLLAGGGTAVYVSADNNPTPPPAAKSGKDSAEPAKMPEAELVENLLKVRKEYWAALDKLRQHYDGNNDIEKERWVQEEIRSFHRMMKYSYRLDIKDVPPPTLQAKNSIPEANALYRRAMEFKGKGTGEEYIDNQRRAEILLQGLLDRHPESDKIADAAYSLGEIYEDYRPRAQFQRAAAYYERCYQWNKAGTGDARMRAARLYDRQLKMYDKAKELYKAVLNNDTDPNRVAEAERRLNEMSSRR